LEQKLSSKDSAKHKNKQKINKRKIKTTRTNRLMGSQITLARKQLKLSQRELANQMDKSQSWVRDVEKGRFHPKLEDQNKLHQILQEHVHAENE
jgi:ribosome-binding protein aMBF1 (putative translation factor)